MTIMLSVWRLWVIVFPFSFYTNLETYQYPLVDPS
jgi:hypothetical protein